MSQKVIQPYLLRAIGFMAVGLIVGQLSGVLGTCSLHYPALDLQGAPIKITVLVLATTRCC